jgi:hypothetical protein
MAPARCAASLVEQDQTIKNLFDADNPHAFQPAGG